MPLVRVPDRVRRTPQFEFAEPVPVERHHRHWGYWNGEKFPGGHQLSHELLGHLCHKHASDADRITGQ